VEVNCAVCDHAAHLWQDFRRLRHHIKWDLYECSKCSFQFWYPLEQSPREYFEDNYTDFSDASLKPSKLGCRHQMLIKHMPVRTGTVLDIGCGDGSFLAKLRYSGFDVWGIDFNRKAIAKAKHLLNLNNLFPLSIYDFVNLPNKPRVNLITFFEVLEHIENPKRFITSLKSLLEVNGFIALSVPDSRMFGPWEYQVNAAPYHTAYWTPSTLTTFLSKNDFDVLMIKKIERPDAAAIIVNAFMKLGVIKTVPSSTSTAAGPVKVELAPHKEILRKALKAVVRFIGFPIREVLYAVGVRPTIFVLAQLNCAEEVSRHA